VTLKGTLLRDGKPYLNTKSNSNVNRAYPPPRCKFYSTLKVQKSCHFLALADFYWIISFTSILLSLCGTEPISQIDTTSPLHNPIYRHVALHTAGENLFYFYFYLLRRDDNGYIVRESAKVMMSFRV
jgi:hypothetical protein